MDHRPNPLVDDRLVDFVLHEVLAVERLCALPYFADHDWETLDGYLATVRRFARTRLFDSYRTLDDVPPRLEDGQVHVHPLLRELLPELIDLGVLNATRPAEVGGAQLPLVVGTVASIYPMAANLAVTGYLGLTTGAAHLIERFGSDALKGTYMAKMYAGEWTGTMALTEPQAGSSLSDVTTGATPAEDGGYRIRGAKIFISGGDQDVTDNVVHLVLARIDGAPAGTKGISLFVVPRRRPEGDGLVDNDVAVTGLIHKIGWKGLPSVALAFGERGDCHGFLVGEAGAGLKQMFQMMNEARLLVGTGGVASASAAYHESVAYAAERTQGRPLGVRDPTTPPVPLTAHADVRRMLLRQKAIVEGGLCLIATTALQADLAEHAEDDAVRTRARRLLDLLTPVAKSFPAEFGFEANTLAVQVHGGYGYTTEYLPEAWLRDQKLNSLHEGTTGIQGLDLLGRKVVAEGGQALMALGEAVGETVARAEAAGIPDPDPQALARAVATVGALTAELGARGAGGDLEGMLRASADFLVLFSVVTVAWQHLAMAAAATECLAAGQGDADRHRGTVQGARYWFETELPRVPVLAERCRGGASYAELDPAWL